MRVLVTGGTGYLGQAVVRALAVRGHELIVFARQASRAGLPGRAVDGDIRDRQAVMEAARGTDAICHLAALVAVWRPNARDFDDVNVGGLENVLAAVESEEVPRLVYTTSFMALPPAGRATPLAGNDYMRSKTVALAVARRACDRGAPIVMLEPGVVYGPGLVTEGNLLGRMLADHLAGRLPGLIGPDRIWSYAFVEDVARAHVAAVLHGQIGQLYPLGGENVPQIRPFEMLRDRRGVKLPRRVPFWAATALGVIEERRARWTGRPPLLTAPTVEIFRNDWPVGHEEAARDLGFRVTPLATGLTATLETLPETRGRRST